MGDPPRPSTAAGRISSASSLSSQLASISPRNITSSSASSYDKNSSPSKDSSSQVLQANAQGNSRALEPASAPFTPRKLNFPNRLSLQLPSRGPLSPVLDPALGYSVARRPRLDFARACTSLHHSTLAEQPSPDSSPLAPTCFPIPHSNGGNGGNKLLDSPIGLHHTNHSSSHASSLGSTSLFDYSAASDDDSSSADEDLDVDTDLELTTPTSAVPITGSAASISLINHRRVRLGARSSRNSRSNSSKNSRPSSSSSGGGGSNICMTSPPPTTPPIQQRNRFSGGYFGRSQEMVSGRKRQYLDQNGGGGGADEEKNTRIPSPVRRAVSRRGSLLPKPKTFQRVKAALMEEISPVDTDVKHEAEITRQIREEDGDYGSPPTPLELKKQQLSLENELRDIREEDESMGSSGDNASQAGNRGIGISFSRQAQQHGAFWFGDQLEIFGGSPPRFRGPRMGSDGDIVMHSDSVVNSPIARIPEEARRPKRRHTQDERFEPMGFKRRAVSPGVLQSPISATSPPMGSASGGGKRLNFQGLTDTHDGLRKMSLQ